MTKQTPYTVHMNTLFLMSMPVKGLLFSLLLLLLCFFGIHLVILARYGWEYSQTAPNTQVEPKKEEEKKAPAEKMQEPIYYIVERKTRRAKSTYGEPKQIDFKPQK